MTVSSYLDPVLKAALAHAEVPGLYEDENINITVRNRLATNRFNDLQAAWAQALTDAQAIEAAQSVVDEAAIAWQPLGIQTAAYKAFARQAQSRPEVSTTELAKLYQDLLWTDTDAPAVYHSSKVNIDLKPVVVSLVTPAMRPSQLGALRIFARNRLQAALDLQLSDLEVWDLWIRAGGLERPEYRAWKERRDRDIRPAFIAPVGTAVVPPGAPGQFDVLRPNVLIPPVPNPDDIVTGLEVTYRVPAATRAIPGIPARVSPVTSSGALRIQNVDPIRAVCLYYTEDTDFLVSAYVPTPQTAQCNPAPPGQEVDRITPPRGGIFNTDAIVIDGVLTEVGYVTARRSRVDVQAEDPVRQTQLVPYDGRASTFDILKDLTVTEASNQPGLVEVAWVNAVGTGPKASRTIETNVRPLEKFGRPNWVSVAVDDAATPRVQQIGIMAGVQYAPIPNNPGAANARQTVTLIVKEVGTGTALATKAEITRASPVVHVVISSTVLDRNNSFEVSYRNGSATLQAAAEALPLLAQYTVAAAPDPFYIHT